MGDTMSKHAAPQETWLNRFKERQAKHQRNKLHLCYGSRCAEHSAAYYAWTAGRAL